MKRLSRYPSSIIIHLSLVLLMTGCSSRQQTLQTVTVDSTSFSSCSQLHTELKLRKSDSISSSLVRDHIDFHEGLGHIEIHTDGSVSISGAKSITTSRSSTESLSHSSLSRTDSVGSQTGKKTFSETSVTTVQPSSTSMKTSLIIGCTVFVIIIVLVIYRRISAALK